MLDYTYTDLGGVQRQMHCCECTREPHRGKALRRGRGCRADPQAPECKDCGRCPMTSITKAKRGPMGMTQPKTVKIESQERCREARRERCAHACSGRFNEVSFFCFCFRALPWRFGGF